MVYFVREFLQWVFRTTLGWWLKSNHFSSEIWGFPPVQFHKSVLNMFTREAIADNTVHEPEEEKLTDTSSDFEDLNQLRIEVLDGTEEYAAIDAHWIIKELKNDSGDIEH